MRREEPGKRERIKEKKRDGRKGRKVPCPDGKRRTGIKKALVAIARTLPCHFGDWILMEEFVSIVPFSVAGSPFFARSTPTYKHNAQKIV